MIGAWLNAAGILVGGGFALAGRKSLSPANEGRVRIALGVFAVFYGLRLTWLSVNGSPGKILKQLLVLVVSLLLGKLAGQMLRLQRMSNRVGQEARERIARTKPGDPDRAGAGFKTCAALFCAAPLAILGGMQDGLSGYFYPLAIKAVMDGLATMGFVTIFGGGVLLAALPVLVLEGGITLGASIFLRPFLETHQLADPVNAAGGMLVFCVALLILGLKKIEITNYLPALAIAPLLAWLFRNLG